MQTRFGVEKTNQEQISDKLQKWFVDPTCFCREIIQIIRKAFQAVTYQSSFQQFCDSEQGRFSVAGGQLHALVGQVAEGLDQVLHRRVAQVAGRFKKPAMVLNNL